ncbi:MAG TPA: Fpg/Nei family DNA glycosylase [Methanothermobacter sp.]|nr:Fpg/Nei family DNA glycosylase [Methanothermobacter sp.]
MPELPSVEIFKRYFDEHALNQLIKKVDVESPKLVVFNDHEKLENTLEGHEFVSSKRYGKYLFSQLDNDLHLIMHFGMTGYLHYSHKDEGTSPYPRLKIDFANGNHLAFDDARKFGKLGITTDPDKFIVLKRLGPDALQVELEEFQKIFKGRKGMIKPLLLNQNLIAGVGNLYADEILYQTSIHPMTRADQLNTRQWENLFLNMKKVLEIAIEYQDKPDSLPDSYLLPHRHKRGHCPEGGNLDVIKVGGRTTFFCPRRQKTII